MPVRGDQFTEAERKSLQIKVSPIVTYAELLIVDNIISDMNISWTGEDIRNRLFDAGFRIVKIDA